MASKYVDTTAIIQVIGSVFKAPQILDCTDKYHIIEEDFPDVFHRIIFGAMYKIHELGAKTLTLDNIEDYLSSRPKSEAIFKKQKGEEWILKASKDASVDAFDYYYNRLKKFSLLRAYDSIGLDLTDIYDIDNILDIKKKQLQEDILDNSSLDELAITMEKKIEEIRYKHVDNLQGEAVIAGTGIDDLIERLKTTPDVGVPLYGPLINTVTRGAVLKKFYLRSAPTGVGKTRSLIADACYIGCDEMYDERLGWIKTGVKQPTLYITTEQELEEIQTMMLAFLSNVNEDHIIESRYENDEEERVLRAGEILKNSSLYVEELPDFSLKDVEDTIKKNLRDHDIKYVFNPKRVLGQ